MYGGNNYSDVLSEDVIALLSGSIVVIGIIGLVIALLILIGNINIFRKAGYSGWIAIVPFYSDYILHKISDAVNLYWIWLALTACSFLLGAIPVVSLLIFISIIVVNIMFKYRLCVAFGKGGGFCFGLVVLPYIFTMILGCGSAQYIGNNGGNSNTGNNYRSNNYKPNDYGGNNLGGSPQPFVFDDESASDIMPTEDSPMQYHAPQHGGRQNFNDVTVAPDFPTYHPPVNESPRYLSCTKGALSGRSISIKGVMSIGTAPDNTICIPRGTPGVSGKHCRIRYKDGVVAVLDDNSTYGTYIDGRKLQPGTPTVLHRGHTLSLGSPSQSFVLKDS